MKLLSAFSGKKQSMKRKLFGYMFLLAVLLLVLLFAGLLLLGRFTGVKQETYETLEFQAVVFERQIESHMHVEGSKAISRIKRTDNSIELLIRVADNNNEPTDCIRLFKFEQKKKERRAEMASVNTFGQASADNLNYIPFEGRKYGDSSYLIRFDVTEPCELGVIVNHSGAEKDGQLIIRCLGID